MDTIYIPFGSDCSIAYHLQHLNLRQYAFPFDWILSDIPGIIKCLNNNFSNFIDMDYLLPLNQSNNFPLIDDDWPNNCDEKINIQKYKHLLYNFTFCHDFYIGIDMKNVLDKYNRRIERFNMIMKDQNITKIILYIGKKIYDEELDNILKTLGFTNFKIKSKLYSEINKSSDWKRDNFDWVNWITG